MSICPILGNHHMVKHGFSQSIDWFEGKIPEKSHMSWENRWFPVDFPLSQPIDPSIRGVHFKNFAQPLLHTAAVATQRRIPPSDLRVEAITAKTRVESKDNEI